MLPSPRPLAHHDSPRHPRRRQRRRWLLSALTTALPFLPLAASAQVYTTLTQPIQVPLYWTPISWAGSGPAPSKLGLYAALGGSSTPQLFEFDTGGSGFYPLFDATASPGISPWWGADVTPTGYTFDQKYDGGNTTYKGNVVSTPVSLFAGPGGGTPLLTGLNMLVGQTDKLNDTTLANLPSPPLEGAFWGDFGLALKQGKSGKDPSGGLPAPAPTIDSFVAQLQYGSGVTPGYRVHASAQNPWVQFGLSSADLALPSGAISMALNPGSGSSPASIPYYSEYVVTGTLAVSDGVNPPFYDANTGMIFDTGAYTTIHNASGRFPAALESGGQVVDGALVQVGPTPTPPPSGLIVSTPFLNFQAGSTVNQDLVWVKGNTDYYFNTGILPFLSYDIVFDLGGAQLALLPRSEPVPSPVGAAGLAAAASISRRLRRRCQRRRP